MILFIAASIYLPTLFIHPYQNFIYSTNSYSAPYEYVIQNGKLEKRPYPYGSNSYYKPTDSQTLFIHDVKENKSRQISFEEAQGLNFDPNPISQEGFEIVQGSGSYGLFPFSYSGSSRYSHYLKKDSFSKRLNINTAGNYYDYKFLGWVQ